MLQPMSPLGGHTAERAVAAPKLCSAHLLTQASALHDRVRMLEDRINTLVMAMVSAYPPPIESADDMPDGHLNASGYLLAKADESISRIHDTLSRLEV